MQTERTTNPTRDAYRQKCEAQLKEWDAKIAQMKAQSQKWSADAKLALTPKVDAADRTMGTAKAKFQRFEAVAEDKWEEFKGDLERTWEDVKAKVEGAYDAVTSHKAN